MNLLLLRPEESSDSQVTLNGRRAAHLLGVLRVEPTSTVRVGVVGRGTATATVREITERSVHLELGALQHCMPPPLSVVLALPRPKALSRTIQAAASFGVRRLALINAWRVEKSYFSSPRLAKQRLADDAWLGCEQGAQVHVPKVDVIRHFNEFTELARSEPDTDERRLCLHPQSSTTLWRALERPPARLCLALGPEGGFIQRELDSLQGVGFQIARMATGPLKTEVALAAALGQASVHYPDSGRRHSA